MRQGEAQQAEQQADPGESRYLEGRVSGHPDQQDEERRGADADGLLRGRGPHRPRGADHDGAGVCLRGPDQPQGAEEQAHDGEDEAGIRQRGGVPALPHIQGDKLLKIWPL